MLPRHIAIIMDGNGRWAQSQGYTRSWGHRVGAQRVDEIVDECSNLGIPYLTLFAFSTENWKRPPAEINAIMRLLVQYLRKLDKKLVRGKVSLVAQGSLERLPGFVQKELKRVVDLTALENPKMRLNLSLSYGGRQEIVDCARRWLNEIREGRLAEEDLNEENFSRFLYHPEFPDPDLLIRTGGESRVSNFLLWEIAYTELYVTDIFWPEFDGAALRTALSAFEKKQRRYGKTGEQIMAQPPTQPNMI